LLGVQSIALTQDGKTVFSSSGGTRTFQHTEKTGNGIAVWNAETREHLGTREFPSQVYQVSVSADGEHLLVVGKQWAEVWSAVDPALLGQE
jgi:DNA-binding beta-propeller fold protein YncE